LDAEAPFSGTVLDLWKNEFILKTEGVLMSTKKNALLWDPLWKDNSRGKKAIGRRAQKSRLPNKELAGYADQESALRKKSGNRIHQKNKKQPAGILRLLFLR
jgi:hypothetical protein